MPTTIDQVSQAFDEIQPGVTEVVSQYGMNVTRIYSHERPGYQGSIERGVHLRLDLPGILIPEAMADEVIRKLGLGPEYRVEKIRADPKVISLLVWYKG